MLLRRRAYVENAALWIGDDPALASLGDLEESLDFYTEVLGFEIESSNPTAEPPIASVKSGSLRITLVQQIETMLKRGRGVHFVLGVADVDEFYQRLSARMIDISEPRDEGWGGRFVSLQDPDGYRLFFVNWQ
jgi:predicted enzyme related to lactoylglutathione lyase